MNDSIETKLNEFWGRLHNVSNELRNVIHVCEDVRSRRILGESKDGARLKKSLEELEKDLQQLVIACSELFRIWFPRVGPGQRLHSEFRNTTPVKVLWVEDDNLQMSRLRGQFIDAKWQLTYARSVDEGFAFLETHTFDGVMVDMLMPFLG